MRSKPMWSLILLMSLSLSLSCGDHESASESKEIKESIQSSISSVEYLPGSKITTLDSFVGAELEAVGDALFAWSGNKIRTSVDGGKSWSDALPYKANTWFGTGRSLYFGYGKQFVITGQGLFVSKDAGETYSKVDLGTTATLSSMIMLDDQKWVIATANAGLLVTYDGGNSFYNRTRDDGLPSNSVTHLGYSNGQLLFLSNSKIVKSTDYAETFSLLESTNGLPTTNISHLAVSHNNVAISTGTKLLVSTDRGVTFQERTLPSGSSSIGALSLLGKSLVYYSNSRLFTSKDLGISFVIASKDQGLADPFVSTIEQSETGIYAIYRTHVSVSTDGGRMYVQKSFKNPLGSTDYIVDAKSNGKDILVLTGDEMKISYDGGKNYDRIVRRPQEPSYIRAVAGEGTRIFVAGDTGLFTSNDSGNTFQYVKDSSYIPRIYEMAYSNTVLYMSLSDRVQYSTDRGLTFQKSSVPTTLTPSTIRTIAKGNGAIFLATPTGVFISTSKGKDFSRIPETDLIGRISDIAVSEKFAHITSSTGLFKVDLNNNSITKKLSQALDQVEAKGRNVYASSTSKFMVSNDFGENYVEYSEATFVRRINAMVATDNGFIKTGSNGIARLELD